MIVQTRNSWNRRRYVHSLILQTHHVPNSHSQFVKFGLTTEALRSYVTLITAEVRDYISASPQFVGQSGTLNVLPTMEEITIYTASRSLQGAEVRARFDETFARLYHDLDKGFSPINFMLPWAPLPHNRKRDIAHNIMTDTYMAIIQARKEAREKGEAHEGNDMIANLMSCTYKDGTDVPDIEVAHMMIALLMAGQHSSASTSAWIMLRLASRPDFFDELYDEQQQVLGQDLPPLTYDDLPKLKLHAQIVKETLRIHAPIHTIMRKVTAPLRIETMDGSKTYAIPTTHTLLAAPGVTSRSTEYFPEPLTWEPHRWEPGHELSPTSTLDQEEEKIDYGYGLVSKGTNSPYLPFGAGRHRCIGEQFAYLQLQVILAIFVREFKCFRNSDGSQNVVETDYSVSQP
jgi:cytochrome P450